MYLYAFFIGLITLIFTFLGSSLVFFINENHKKVLNTIIWLSYGIIISSSFFSLLSESFNISKELYNNITIPIFGFFCGLLVLYISDNVMNKVVKNNKDNIILFLSMVIHNIPDGLSLGVVLGSSLFNSNMKSLLIFVFIISLQNIPEGFSISLPFKKSGVSKIKAFLYGGLSAIVEPFSSLLGFLMVEKVKLILPFLLSAASSSMFYVVFKEMYNDHDPKDNVSNKVFIMMIGFLVMMLLEIII